MRKRVITFLWGLVLLQTAHANLTNVSELMDKFAETQDKAKTSFISKAIETKNATYNYPAMGLKANDVKTNTIEEFRTDGNKLKVIHRKWGWISSVRPDRHEDNKSHISWLWDGDKFYQYVKTLKGEEAPEGYPGKLFLDQREDKDRVKREASVTKIARTYPFSGYFHNRFEERIDKLINADNSSIDRDMEMIENSACYVITVEPENGVRLKIWIDPQHGYNIAKYEYRAGEGYYRSPAPRWKKEDRECDSGKVLRFEKINDLWVPVEMEMEDEVTHPSLNQYQHRKIHYTVTEFMVDPDHDALGSFLPDDIRNGAKVMLTGVEGITYAWQDGKLIPKIDENVMKQIDGEIEKIRDEKRNPKSETNQIPPADMNVSELLDKYRTTQNHLQSFIARGENSLEETTDHDNELNSTSREETSSSEFRYDGDRVNHRIYSWNKVTSKEQARYQSFLWNGELFITYQKGSGIIESRISITKHDTNKDSMIASEYKGAGLMGICGGDWDPIDSILKKADTLTLRDKMELIGDSECYAIDAKTKRGAYVVWLDPAHGYNIAQIEVKRDKGDWIYFNKPLEKTMTFSLKNVHFAKIDEVWVPMEADMEQIEDDGRTITKYHHKRTEMLLNPDHEALQSFVPDDIPDGTKVELIGSYDSYIWQKGQPVKKGD